jgi:hypothetical protein
LTKRRQRGGFATRPGDPDAWVQQPEPPPGSKPGTGFTARLTIDMTPALRARIKIAAFRRGLTATDLLRALLEREFPEEERAP